MSFQKPSGDVIALTSGDMSIASGTLKIELNLRDADNLFGSDYIIDVTDIGGVEVDYDYVEEIGDINDFKINVPSVEFEMLDAVKNAADYSDTAQFVEMITKLNANDLIVVKFTFNGSSDYYYTTREKVEFSYSERKVKLALQHPLKYGTEPYGVTWGTQLASYYVDTALLNPNVPGGYTIVSDSVFAKDFISEYLSALSESSTLYFDSEVYINNSVSYNDGSGVSDGDSDFLFIASSTLVDSDYASATNAMRGLAFNDSAIIGNILGSSFYIPRYSKVYSSNITSDVISKLELDHSFKDIRYFSLVARYGEVGSILSFSIPINDEGIFDASLNLVTDYATVFDGLKFCEARNTTGSILFEYGLSFTDPLNPSLSESFANKFRDAYLSALSIPRSSGTDAGSRISGSIIGVDTLLPHQYMAIPANAGIHPLVDGKDFRPSYLKYNLKDDIIEFEAYEF